MPGGRYTFYTSCQALPHGLHDPRVRSAQSALHVPPCARQPCPLCLQPVPRRNRGRAGQGWVLARGDCQEAGQVAAVSKH